MKIQTAKKYRTACIIGLIVYVATAAPTVKSHLSEYYGLTSREAQVMQFFIPLGAGLLFRLSPAGKTLARK